MIRVLGWYSSFATELLKGNESLVQIFNEIGYKSYKNLIIDVLCCVNILIPKDFDHFTNFKKLSKKQMYFVCYEELKNFKFTMDYSTGLSLEEERIKWIADGSPEKNFVK